MTTFNISGRVINFRTRQGINGLRVEVWDKDLIYNDLVGGDLTDEQGSFQILFDESYFQELFHDQQPDLFFKVFQGDQLIKSTEDSVLWNISTANPEIIIEVMVNKVISSHIPEGTVLVPTDNLTEIMVPEIVPETSGISGYVFSNRFLRSAGFESIEIDKSVLSGESPFEYRELASAIAADGDVTPLVSRNAVTIWVDDDNLYAGSKAKYIWMYFALLPA